MNDMDIIRLIAGLLQFGVALYALRLSRLFKSMLMGWVLFGALSVLALLNLFLAVEPFDAGAQWGIKVDVIYSLLLLAGVMRFYSGLKNFLREEETKRQALDKWESQVKEQWVELIKANEKLRQTITRLETEVAERKLAQEEGEKNLQALLAASRQNETALPPVVTVLQTEVVEQTPEPAPEPAEKNGEPTLAAPPQNGGEPLPMVAGFNTDFIAQEPAPEPAEKNGEHPLTAPPQNGGESLPMVAGFNTVIVTEEPAPEPARKNGRHPLTARRKNLRASRRTTLLPGRKIAARTPSRSGRKKPARTR